MYNIGLIFKPNLKEIDEIFQELLKIERDFGVCFYVLEGIDQSKSPLPFIIKNEETKIDYILCFGGDGTMLRSVESSIEYDAPVLGVNFGKLGFLSESSFKELKNSIEDIVSKKYYLETRMLIDVYINNDIEVIKKALNDVAIFKGNDSKLLKIRLYENTQYVYETRSDGMVVSTPTGSTAYSLSAGGPILSPSMSAMIVTPLNPHVLSVRPMVFSDNDVIELRLSTNEKANIQIDGISYGELDCNDKVVIRKSKDVVKFVKLTQKSFYNILRTKFNMGKRS